MYDVSYVASVEGDYVIDVRIQDEHIQDSPFYAVFEPYKREAKESPLKDRTSSVSSAFANRRSSGLKIKRYSTTHLEVFFSSFPSYLDDSLTSVS